MALALLLLACDPEQHPKAAVGGDLSNISAEPEARRDAGRVAPKLGRTQTDAGVASALPAGHRADLEGPPEHDAGAGTLDPESSCGDGWIDNPAEECDGHEANCFDLGFDTRRAGCSSTCTWKLQLCEGTENCFDGRDNDGDGLVDCLDTQDCQEACSAPCLQAPTLNSTDQLLGNIRAHAPAPATSCALEAGGPSVVYRLTADTDGKLDLLLNSSSELLLSVATTCGEPLTELSCSVATRQTLEVSAGQELFVTVSGLSASDLGGYSLQTVLRQLACGDGIRDEEEACDDGNLKDGDGCDPDCNLETQEFEPFNNSGFGANWYRFFEQTIAEIRPSNDVDFYRVVLTEQNSTLMVETLNLGDGACALNLMDTVIDVFDTIQNGNQLIVTDDNSGDGLCARAIATGLSPGAYTVRVSGAAFASPGSFPYELRMTAVPCGDGQLGPGEQCDDGNQTNGDGCTSTCRMET